MHAIRLRRHDGKHTVAAWLAMRAGDSDGAISVCGGARAFGSLGSRQTDTSHVRSLNLSFRPPALSANSRSSSSKCSNSMRACLGRLPCLPAPTVFAVAACRKEAPVSPSLSSSRQSRERGTGRVAVAAAGTSQQQRGPGTEEARGVRFCNVQSGGDSIASARSSEHSPDTIFCLTTTTTSSSLRVDLSFLPHSVVPCLASGRQRRKHGRAFNPALVRAGLRARPVVRALPHGRPCTHRRRARPGAP